ncbi:hypothetical protein [Halarcobacter sp.]|uniref:hypothetical protein n=1 Tax=Halarcobacter sp. TaxID=2321133 RepID=UPI002AAADAF8|nr:hypothetical protein [Halarcobacter sp.]
MININLIYLGIVFLVIIVVLLIVLLIVFSGKNEKSNNKSKNKNYHVPMPTTYSLDLPKIIESMSKNQLRDISKKIFESYRSFDYKNQSTATLAKKEWHSWQVSILLMTFKRLEDLVIYDQEDIFPDIIINSTENDIKSLMRDIIRKYEQYVDFNQSKDALCKDYIWSNRDVSIIFYFLANYKNYSK